VGARFDAVVKVDHPFACRGTGGAAAAHSAGLGRNCRLAQCLVDFFDQEPRSAVRHPDGSSRGGNGPGRADRLEKRNLAWADTCSRGEIKANGETSAGHEEGLPSEASADPRRQWEFVKRMFAPALVSIIWLVIEQA
jgi:hypothetical protein